MACRRRILQYRNERQQLAACQRLQEGKESKQVRTQNWHQPALLQAFPDPLANGRLLTIPGMVFALRQLEIELTFLADVALDFAQLCYRRWTLSTKSCCRHSMCSAMLSGLTLTA